VRTENIFADQMIPSFENRKQNEKLVIICNLKYRQKMKTINSQAKWCLKSVKSEKERLVHVISASFLFVLMGKEGHWQMLYIF